jgi:hypothetical protein
MTIDQDPNLWAALYRERWGVTPPPVTTTTREDDDE